MTSAVAEIEKSVGINLVLFTKGKETKNTEDSDIEIIDKS